MKQLFYGSNSEWMGNSKSIAIHEDSLKVLKLLGDNTVDLIFADPPYGLGKDFGYQNPDSFKSAQEYFEWAKEWIDECMRVLKPDGTMYFMCSVQNMPLIDVYISERYYIISRLVWTYDSSGTQSKKRFGSLYEPMLMITHSPKSNYTFNAEDILVETTTGSKRQLIDYRKTPPQPYNTKKLPGNVWNFNRVRFKMAEYENHPTQKPEVLLERIILASSNPNDIVLDPFAGTFTTSAVAIKYGRFAIGIESNEDYYRIGLRRTGITTTYKGEILEKDLSRKTNNKSKIDHIKDLTSKLKELDQENNLIDNLDFSQVKLTNINPSTLSEEELLTILAEVKNNPKNIKTLEELESGESIEFEEKVEEEIVPEIDLNRTNFSYQDSIIDYRITDRQALIAHNSIDFFKNEKDDKDPHKRQEELPLESIFGDLLQNSPIATHSRSESNRLGAASPDSATSLAEDLTAFLTNAFSYRKEDTPKPSPESLLSDKELIETFNSLVPKAPANKKNTATHVFRNPVITSAGNAKNQANSIVNSIFDKKAVKEENGQIIIDAKVEKLLNLAFEIKERKSPAEVTQKDYLAYLTACALLKKRDSVIANLKASKNNEVSKTKGPSKVSSVIKASASDSENRTLTFAERLTLESRSSETPKEEKTKQRKLERPLDSFRELLDLPEENPSTNQPLVEEIPENQVVVMDDFMSPQPPTNKGKQPPKNNYRSTKPSPSSSPSPEMMQQHSRGRHHSNLNSNHIYPPNNHYPVNNYPPYPQRPQGQDNYYNGYFNENIYRDERHFRQQASTISHSFNQGLAPQDFFNEEEMMDPTLLPKVNPDNANLLGSGSNNHHPNPHFYQEEYYSFYNGKKPKGYEDLELGAAELTNILTLINDNQLDRIKNKPIIRPTGKYPKGFLEMSNGDVETPSGYTITARGKVYLPQRRGRRSKLEKELLAIVKIKKNITPQEVEFIHLELSSREEALRNQPPKKRGRKSNAEKQALALMAKLEGK